MVEFVPRVPDPNLRRIGLRRTSRAETIQHFVAYSAHSMGNEVIIDESADGTYFCVCGFKQGYYGLQETRGGKKLLIFSAWAPGTQNDPNTVAEEQRVKLLYCDEAVRIGRFEIWSFKPASHKTEHYDRARLNSAAFFSALASQGFGLH